jgi:hypothetical protein
LGKEADKTFIVDCPQCRAKVAATENGELLAAPQSCKVTHLIDWCGVTWTASRRDMAHWKEVPEEQPALILRPVRMTAMPGRNRAT